MPTRSTISNQHAQAQSLHKEMLHTCWQQQLKTWKIKSRNYGKKELDVYVFQ